MGRDREAFLTFYTKIKPVFRKNALSQEFYFYNVINRPIIIYGRIYNIVKPVVFTTKILKSFLQDNKIATMLELKAALGTDVDMTVFRKLRELSYRTSYTHLAVRITPWLKLPVLIIKVCGFSAQWGFLFMALWLILRKAL